MTRPGRLFNRHTAGGYGLIPLGWSETLGYVVGLLHQSNIVVRGPEYS